jgi:hypothetical protein
VPPATVINTRGVAELPITWRVRLAGRLLGAAFTAGMCFATIASAIALARGKGGGSDLVPGLVIFPAMALLAWRATMGSWLRLTSAEVIVRNPIRLTRIPLHEVADVNAGRGGVVIRRADQSVVVAWAVQKAPLAAWFRWHTRADDIVDAIQKAARAAGAPAPARPERPMPVREELRQELRRYPKSFHPRHGRD